jgi:hypothetical protein
MPTTETITTTAVTTVTITSQTQTDTETEAELENSRPMGAESESAETFSSEETLSETESTTVTSETVTTTTAEQTTTTASTTVTSETATAPTITTTVPEIITETAETTVAEMPSPLNTPIFTYNDFQVTPKLLIILALVIALVGGYFANKAHKKKKAKLEAELELANPTSAKSRDAMRMNEEKKRKAESQGKKKTKKREPLVPKAVKDVLAVLPYKRVLDDNLWLIDTDTYSKAYTFDDINYNMGDSDQQYACLDNFCNFLNTIDDSLDCQITMFNKPINIADFEKDILIYEKGEDEFSELRQEYNERLLKPAITKGKNALKKMLCVTLTIKTSSEEKAYLRFKALDREIKASFDRIGTTALRVMTSQERVEILRDIFRDPTDIVPELTAEDFVEGLEKVYCAPDDFEWKTGYFVYGDMYASTLYLKEYPANANDYIFTDLMKTDFEGGGKLIVTTNIIAHDPGKARKLVQSQITAIQTNMAQRNSKAAQHGVFQENPPKIQKQIDGLTNLFKKLTDDDQKLFSVNTVIMVTGHEYTDLKHNMDIIQSTLKRDSCQSGEMKYQQKDGLRDVLPCGSHRAFQFRRSLNTECVAIFHPFNVKEVQHKNSVYYGLNVLSDNIITFNKFTLQNPSGFILGSPGSGKSFSAKREIVDAFLRFENADIMIIDPEREYGALVNSLGGSFIKISSGSTNYINPFEFDIDLLDAVIDDEKVDVMGDKSTLITGFISAMDTKNPINAQESSFIDRIVQKCYAPLLKALEQNDYKHLPKERANEIKHKYMPTLGTFYDILLAEDDVDVTVKNRLKFTLEKYVTGTANYFNNQTNIDINNRIVAYDIKDLSGTMKTQSMLLILDYIWNRLSENREKGRATWIYVDEIYLLFADEYCLNFLKQLYKRARKYGGVLTGITQNVEDLLRNDDCRTMLSNSAFLMLLKQAPADLAKLRETLHFTEAEAFYADNVKAGQGLLVLGGKDKIPFHDEFPKDTRLYELMSTSFAEAMAEKQGKQKATA